MKRAGSNRLDLDGVGGGIIGHAEVHCPADILEPNVVAATNGVGGEGCLLAVDVHVYVGSV